MNFDYLIKGIKMNVTMKTVLVAALTTLGVSAWAGDKHAHEQALSQTGEYISYEKAREIAVNQVGGSNVRVDDVELDRNRRHGVYYEVELQKDLLEYSVKVDAKTGKVLSVQKELD